MYLKIIQPMNEKPTGIIPKGERLKGFPHDQEQLRVHSFATLI